MALNHCVNGAGRQGSQRFEGVGEGTVGAAFETGVPAELGVGAAGHQQIAAAARQATEAGKGRPRLPGADPQASSIRWGQEAGAGHAGVEVAVVVAGDAARVAAVGDQQHAHAWRMIAEDHRNLVVEEHLARSDVPGAQAFVTTVGFITVLVGTQVPWPE